MGKILPRKKFFRSAIYTPKLNVGSHIDNVRHSLEYLIFASERENETVLLKKRIKVIIIITILFMIVSSLLSPKGKADITTFYPTACLGGWVNPRNAEGAPEVKSNDNEKDFTKENSAFLPSLTQADIYCGNFVGEITENTKPTKIIVTLSWSKGELIIATSTTELESASTTEELLSASSTENATTSTSSIPQIENGTTSQIENSTTTTIEQSNEPSLVDKVITIVGDTFGKLFGTEKTPPTATTTGEVNVPQESLISTTTESVPPQQATSTGEVTPTPESTSTPETPPAPTPIPESDPTPASTSTIESAPTSFFKSSFEKFVTHFIDKVFAEEIATSSVVDVTGALNEINTTTTTPQTIDVIPEEEITTATNTIINLEEASTTVEISSSTSETSSTTEATTTPSSSLEQTTTIGLDTNTEDDATNNFLEVLYSFDGTIWKSLGRVNESSMKYRTFEIPVGTSTSWNDINQLQIKVELIQRVDAIPEVYLDGIKMEVLYETPVIHEHPDFARDTVLKDKSDDGIRVVNIINGDTNANEIWYTTIDDQGGYGVAPGSWVQVVLDQPKYTYKLIDIYGQNIFLLDENQKLLWVKNLQKETNDGIGIVQDGTTTVSFTKTNGEEWLFDYNYKTKMGVVRIKG